MIIGNVSRSGDGEDSYGGAISLFPSPHRLDIIKNRKKQSERTARKQFRAPLSMKGLIIAKDIAKGNSFTASSTEMGFRRIFGPCQLH